MIIIRTKNNDLVINKINNVRLFIIEYNKLLF